MASISLSEFVADRRTIEVDLGIPPAPDGTAQTLTVTYRAKTLTLNDQMQLQRFGKLTVLEESDLAWVTSLMQRLIDSWGLTGPLTGAEGSVIDADAPVPVLPEFLRVISAATLFQVINQCLTDTAANPKAAAPTIAPTTGS